MKVRKVIFVVFSFFVFLFPDLASASSAKAFSKLPDLFYRTLTQEWGNCSKLSPQQRHLFMNTHWTKHLVRERAGDCILDSASDPKFKQVSLYQELGKRLWDDKRNELLPQFKSRIHPYREISDTVHSGDDYADRQSHKFVPGHFHTIKKRTKVPKFLISFNDDPALDAQPAPLGGNKVITSWFIPFEQAFFCRNVKEYRESAALIRHWSAYSRLSLGFIPAGADVSLRLGLLSPQTFPKLIDKSVFKGRPFHGLFDTQERDLVDKSLKNVKSSSSIENLYECVDGGATQIFVAHAAPSYLFPLDALYLNGQIHKQSFSRRRELDKTWAPLDPGESSHLSDNKFDEVNIDLTRALGEQGLGILSKNEREEFEEVLRRVF